MLTDLMIDIQNKHEDLFKDLKRFFSNYKYGELTGVKIQFSLVTNKNDSHIWVEYSGIECLINRSDFLVTDEDRLEIVKILNNYGIINFSLVRVGYVTNGENQVKIWKAIIDNENFIPLYKRSEVDGVISFKQAITDDANPILEETMTAKNRDTKEKINMILDSIEPFIESNIERLKYDLDFNSNLNKLLEEIDKIKVEAKNIKEELYAEDQTIKLKGLTAIISNKEVLRVPNKEYEFSTSPTFDMEAYIITKKNKYFYTNHCGDRLEKLHFKDVLENIFFDVLSDAKSFGLSLTNGKITSIMYPLDKSKTILLNKDKDVIVELETKNIKDLNKLIEIYNMIIERYERKE